MKLSIEVNSNVVKDLPPIGGSIMITPPLDEDFWLARVPVASDQAIVCFPKFGTVGIGFQHEEDWNSNLPYTTSAVDIYTHIEHNKACGATREECIAAIELLREWATAWKEGKNGT